MAGMSREAAAVTLWRSISTGMLGAVRQSVIFLTAEENDGDSEAALLTARAATRDGFRVCLVVASRNGAREWISANFPAGLTEGQVISVGNHALRVGEGSGYDPDVIHFEADGEVMRDVIKSSAIQRSPDLDLRAQWIDAITDRYDFTIVIGGSVIRDPYSMLFLPQVSYAVLVVRANETRLPVAVRAKEKIEIGRAHV